MSGICDKIDKRRRKSSRSRSRDLERTPTTLPICYDSQYPLGCTVLECRFNADRPVARIVQKPADTAAIARNSCLLVEMKPSSDSRILKIDKSEKQLGDSSSKILHCPSSKNILRASFCYDKSLNQPVTFIKCMTIPKGPLARCSTKTSKEKARVSSGQALSERSVPCRKSKPEVTHRSPLDYELACPGRADLKIDISLFPEMKDPLSQVTRKDGRDPSEISCSLKKPSKKYKRRICPTSYCQPVQRSATKDICSDFLHTKSSAPDAKSSPIEIRMMQIRLDDQQRLQRSASKHMLRTEITRIESAKSDKASACQKSMVLKHTSLIPERISRDIPRLSSSQELLARYKKYIPAYQLEKYEACRSKRNGLQDECIPPLLRAILKKEEQQRPLGKCTKRERNVDQSGMSESINQTEFVLYMK